MNKNKLSNILKKHGYDELNKVGVNNIPTSLYITFEYKSNTSIQFVVKATQSSPEYNLLYDYSTKELTAKHKANWEHPIIQIVQLYNDDEDMYEIKNFIEYAHHHNSRTFVNDDLYIFTLLDNGDWYISFDYEKFTKISCSNNKYCYSELQLDSNQFYSSDSVINNMYFDSLDELNAHLFQLSTVTELHESIEKTLKVLEEYYT